MTQLGIGRMIGVTMAVLGILLAMCSALVGSERTELVKTMVEQSNADGEYQAESTKYRLMVAQLDQTYAVTPSRRALDEAAARIDAMPVPSADAQKAALDRATLKETMALLTPRKTEVEHFLSTIARYDEERAAVKGWAASYDDLVHAHFEASETYERAQLVAEVGIVIASIALLLASRPMWGASLLAVLACAGLLGTTYAHARAAERAGEETIEHAKAKYEELRGQKDAAGTRLSERLDAEVLEKIRERFGADER